MSSNVSQPDANACIRVTKTDSQEYHLNVERITDLAVSVRKLLIAFCLVHYLYKSRGTLAESRSRLKSSVSIFNSSLDTIGIVESFMVLSSMSERTGSGFILQNNQHVFEKRTKDHTVTTGVIVLFCAFIV